MLDDNDLANQSFFSGGSFNPTSVLTCVASQKCILKFCRMFLHLGRFEGNGKGFCMKTRCKRIHLARQILNLGENKWPVVKYENMKIQNMKFQVKKKLTFPGI